MPQYQKNNRTTSLQTSLLRWLAKNASSPGRRLDLQMLEERVLYSATPLPIDPDTVDDTSLSTVDARLDHMEAALIAAWGTDGNVAASGTLATHQETSATGASLDGLDSLLQQLVNPGDDNSHDQLAAARPALDAEAGLRHEVVFVQSSLYDLGHLTADLFGNDADGRVIDVIVLDQYENGFAQIDLALSQYTDIDAIHFVTHGADGFIQLGGSWLTAHNVSEHFDSLARWGMSLTDDGDILIYGCDVAATEFGQGLVDSIALATRADVAASTDGTGGLARGGNWTLEYVGGSGFSPVGLGGDRLEAYPTIETENVFGLAVQESYGGLLATYTVTNTNNSGAGSLRQAILDANANPGLDSIVFSISLSDVNHVYYRDDGVAGSFSTPVRTTVADSSITDFDADYLPGTARSWYRITLSGMDLEVTDSVIIDGSTQFGYDAAKGPIIELNAAGITAADPNALTLSGGASTVRGLVINSGKDDAIEIDRDAHGSTIVGNYLGTDVSGLQTTFGNRYGITVKSDGNTIGGTTIADRNIIAANGSHSDSFGIGFWTDSHNNTVQGNYIGVGLDGSTAMSNVNGILFKNTSYDNLIGGTAAGAGNIISGNSEDGIRIDGTASGTIIQGNYIGTDATGTVAVGNGDDGISVMAGASNTAIGGSTAGARNIISANGSTGIYLEGSSTVVQGNYIGTDVTGTLDLGNTKVTTSEGSVRSFNASGAMIGGTGSGEGNLIAFGGGRGILLQGASSGIAILGNSIHSHAGLGIDLGDDGVTLNDGKGSGNPDQDSGANSLQNFPELYAVTAGPAPTLTLLMSSTPNRTFRIEFFANASGNASGYGEGQRYLGFVNVTTNSEGTAKQIVTLSEFISAGEQVSATATDLTTMNTSEFALNVTASNTAPVLDDGKSPALNPQDEDSGPPSGAVGTLISSLVDFGTPAGQVDNVSDADPGAALGIAITAANTTYGTWYYSTNGGSTWNSLGAVSGTNARLLAADANTRLYFQPTANYNGTLADAITFRAWDQTSGVNGGTSPITLGTHDVLDTFSSQSYSNNHGSQSWSTNWVESDSQGGGAGDGRFRVSGGRLQMQASNAGNWIYREVDLSGAASANFSFSYSSGLGGNAKVHAQVSHDGGATYTTLAGGIFDGSANTGNGTKSFDISSAVGGNTRIRFYVAGGETGAGNHAFAVDDVQVTYTLPGGGTTAFSTATDTASLVINPVNDAPVLTPYAPVYPTNEDATPYVSTVATLLQTSVSDVDAGAVKGIAVYNVSGGGGVLEYSIDGGSSWNSFGSLSSTSALLLRATDQIRFTPDSDNGGTLTADYRAWDQTSPGGGGGAGTKVDVSDNGGTTAFSSATDRVTVISASINDAPVLADTALGLVVAGNSGGPESASGSLVSEFTGGITDVDTGAVKGIAIVASDETNGTWYYTTNGGVGWNAVGTVDASSSLLLADDANTRLHFVPVAGYDGNSLGALTIRAWDRSDGSTAGTKVSTASTGHTTSFSSATDVIDVEVQTSLSGVVFMEDGITPIGANKTVRVAINGTDFGTTAETDAHGAYSIAGLNLSAGDVLTVYLEDEAEDAVVVTVSNGHSLANLDLHQDRLITRHDNAGSLTTADLATAAVAAENDISNIYSVSGSSLTVNTGNELLVWAGHTFTAGGNLMLDDVDIKGTLNLGSYSATVSGNWDASGGSFASSGNVSFDFSPTPGSIQVIDNGDAGFSTVGSWSSAAGGYQSDLLYHAPGSGAESATWTFTVEPGTAWKVATTWTNHANRAIDAPYSIFDGGTWIETFDINQENAPNDFSYNGANWEWLSSDVFYVSSGTLVVQLTNDANEYVIADGVYLQQIPTVSILSGGNAFHNLSLLGGDFVSGDALHVSGNLNLSGGSLTLGGELDVDGDLVLGAGAMLDVSAASHAINAGGNWTDNGGNFRAQSGTVTLDSTTAGKTITAASNFYHLDLNGSGGQWTLLGDITAENGLQLSAGTLVQSNAALTISAPVTMDGGTFVGSTQDLTIHGGLAINAGSFTATSANLTMNGNFIQNGGTFAHNDGTLRFSSGNHSLGVTDALNDLELVRESVGKFDFNSSTSPTAAGYTGVSGQTRYSAALGYGWHAAVGTAEGTGPDDLRRDVAIGAGPSTFSIATGYANTDLWVTVYAGFQSSSGNHMEAYNADNHAQGAFDISTASGEHVSRSFLASVGADGILNIIFGDAGGGPNFLFSGIDVQGAPTVTLTKSLNVQGSLTLNEGADLDGASHTIALAGDWNNYAGAAAFRAGTSTVQLNGSGTQNVRGSTDFYNLEISTAIARTVHFESNQTQSIVAGGSITLAGAAGQELTLASLALLPGGDDWLLNVDMTATQSVSYVSVSHSDASAGAMIDAEDGTNTDGGSNANWKFPNNAPVLDESQSPVLDAQYEDSGAPVGLVGTLVSSLVDFASPAGQVDNVTDADDGALLGIAITNADLDHGSWFYSVDGGNNWIALGAVAGNNARLLAADAYTRLYFQPNANYNGTLASAITFRAWDRTTGTNGSLADTTINGGRTAFSVATDTAELTVIPVNDAPVEAAIESAPLAYNENDGAVAITSTLALSDVDDTHLESAVVKISGNYVNGQDVLGFTDQNGISGTWDAASGEMRLSGTATLAEYEAALRSVTYTNISDDPSAAIRTVSFTVNDGDADSNTQTRNIEVAPVNDAPSGTDKTVSTMRDIDYTFMVSDFGFRDVDGDQFAAVTISGLPTAGTLYIDANGDGEYNVGEEVALSSSIVIATISDGNLRFRAASGGSGAGYASFAFQVQDDGGTTNGGSDTAPTASTMTIDVGDAYRITGNIYEDINGDSSLADAVAAGGVTVYLYRDSDLDGDISAGDTLYATTSTDFSGRYTFSSLLDDTYFVVVDSRTIAPTAGLNSGFTQFDIWAEQTYGSAGAAHGAGFLSAAGALFGGRVADVSDDASSLLTAQHVTRVAVSGADVYDLDSAFSFNVVTGVRDGDDVAGQGRSVQGSFRQFIDNANALSGSNAMRFVPGVAANTAGGTGKWWTIQAASAFSVLSDAGTSLDGTAYSWTDGTNAQDSNVGQFGGALVGVGADGIAGTADDPVLASFDRQELEIVGAQSAYQILDIAGADNTLANLAIRKPDEASSFALVKATGDGFTMHDVLIGTSADGSLHASQSVLHSLVDVAAANAQLVHNYYGLDPTNEVTVLSVSGTNALVSQSEFNVSNGRGILIDASNIAIRENLFGNSAFWAIQNLHSNVASDVRIHNNTIFNTAGIFLDAGAASFEISHNHIHGNTNGILVSGGKSGVAAATNVVLTKNSIHDNAGIGIDNEDTSANDGQLIAEHANRGIDHPVISSASLIDGALMLAGYVGAAPGQTTFANARVEFFIADAGGQGQTYLGYLTTDSSGNYAGSLAASGVAHTDKITATATLNGTGTSEFSNALDVNLAPTITSNGGGATATTSVYETVSYVTTVTASDLDAGTTLHYSISGGADAARFHINSSTGVLSFISAPDFEMPSDVGGDNVYDVIVRVSDGALADIQAIAVMVVDVSSSLVVTTTADTNDSGITAGSQYTIEWLNAHKGADGKISLREAIIAANNTLGHDTLSFDIAGDGVHTINVLSSLPAITDAITIDGYSQSGASANTLMVGSDAVLLVELNGLGAGTGVHGLTLLAGSDGSVIRGLVVNGFDRDGIHINNSDDNTVVGNFLGLKASGGVAQGNHQGIYINNSAGTTIGGTDAASRNVISGNRQNGIAIAGAASTGTVIQGNYVGTNAAGDAAVGTSKTGINILSGASDITIGGIVSGAGNVISGNSANGVALNWGGNRLQGNLIGLNASGDQAVGNGNGVYIYNSANNIIGGNTAAERNVISGNSESGVFVNLAGSTGNVIAGNYIGTTATGTAAIGNTKYGVFLFSGAAHNIIGGTTAGSANLITASGIAGVQISSTGVGNAVLGNSIYANTLLGINHGSNVVSTNDGVMNAGVDGQGMDHPVFSRANLVGHTLDISGYVGSAPGQSAFAGARVEVFLAAVDGTGHGEGKTFLGYVTADANGNFSGTLDVTGMGLTSASVLTATATSTSNNTSEFGANFGANVAPTNIAPHDFSVPENIDTTGGRVLGSLVTADDDVNDTFIYSIVGGSDAGKFSIQGDRLILTDGILDYETKSSYSAIVRTTDSGGLAYERVVTVTVTDVNEAPHDITATGMNIDENVDNGQLVGTVRAIDVDADDTATYQLIDDAEGRFTIDSLGNVTVLDSSRLDYESHTSHDITVQATDAGGATFTKSFTVTLNDVDEFDVSVPTDVDGAVNFVHENSPTGTLVGITAYSVDADATLNVISYTLEDSDGGRFAIDSLTGQVQLVGALDYETEGPMRTIRVRATSSDGSTAAANFVIQVGDVNEAPVARPDEYFTSSIEEIVTSAPGVAANDYDPDGDATSVVLVSGPAVGWATLAADGSLRYRPQAGFVGDVRLEYYITDGDLSSAIQTIVIHVTMPGNVQAAGSDGGSGSSNGSTTSPSVPGGSVASGGTTAGAGGSNGNSNTVTGEGVPHFLSGVGPLQASAESGVFSDLNASAVVVASNALPARSLKSTEVAMFDIADVGNLHASEFLQGLHEQELSRLKLPELERLLFTQAQSHQLIDVLGDQRQDQELVDRMFIHVDPLVATALGTGLVIWLAHAGQFAAALLSTASAWVQLDPLTVIQGAAAHGGVRGEEEAREEIMFEVAKIERTDDR